LEKEKQPKAQMPGRWQLVLLIKIIQYEYQISNSELELN